MKEKVIEGDGANQIQKKKKGKEVIHSLLHGLHTVGPSRILKEVGFDPMDVAEALEGLKRNKVLNT